MTCLPLVVRELRVVSRQASLPWLRAGAAMLSCLIAGGFLFFSLLSFAPPATMGRGLFVTLAAVTLVFCLFEGARATSDCLSEEKREGTLGLLFLTDLRGYDVVLGKLAARSLRTFYAVLAVLPILGLPLLFGGVTLAQFGRTAVALLALLLFSLAVGMCVSSVSEDSSESLVRTLVLVPVIGFGPELLARLSGLAATAAGPWFTAASPLMLCQLAFTTAPVPPVRFLSVLLGALLWSVLLLAAASWLLPRRWQLSLAGGESSPRSFDKNAAPAGVVAAQKPRLWSRGLAWWRKPRALSERRRRKLRAALEENPALWLALRRVGERWSIWVFLGVVAMAAGIVFAFGAPGVGMVGASMTLGWLMPITWPVKLGLTAQAARSWAELRGSGTLDVLRVTPLGGKIIARGEYLAARRTWLWPAMVTLVLTLGLMLGLAWESVIVELFSSSRPEGMWYALGLLLYNMVRFYFDLLALYSVASWLALRGQGSNAATILSILFVQVIPSALFCLPVLLSDLVFIAWASSELDRHLQFGFPSFLPAAPRGQSLTSVPPPPTPSPPPPAPR